MSQSRGAVSFEPLFTAEEIGLGKEAHVEHVMKVFVTLGEGLASRWIEMPRGVLLLQTVPDDPASGAIYLDIGIGSQNRGGQHNAETNHRAHAEEIFGVK